MDQIWELSKIVDRLLIEFQMIACFLMTTGFILKIRRTELLPESILSVIATTIVILGLMTSQNWWFKETQGLFFEVAHVIKVDYETHPFDAMIKLRRAKMDQERREGIGHILSNVRAWSSELFLKAMMALLMKIASIIQILYTCLYCTLIEIYRLLFPIALACYMFEGLRSLGFQFVLRALSVMAWPVGFALIERVAQALQVHFYQAASVTDRLHGGILFPLMICIWVIGGTLKVPSFMNALFSGGDVGSSAGGWITAPMHFIRSGFSSALSPLIKHAKTLQNITVGSNAILSKPFRAALPALSMSMSSQLSKRNTESGS